MVMARVGRQRPEGQKTGGVIRTGACTHPAPAQTTLGLEDLHVDLP